MPPSYSAFPSWIPLQKMTHIRAKFGWDGLSDFTPQNLLLKIAKA